IYRDKMAPYLSSFYGTDGEGILDCELCALAPLRESERSDASFSQRRKASSQGRVVVKFISIPRRLVEFRVVDLDVVFDLGNFYDYGHRWVDLLHRVRDFDAVYNLVILHVDFQRHLPLRAFGLSILANEQTGVDVEVELFGASFGRRGFDHIGFVRT